jgi:hypothetical protein
MIPTTREREARYREVFRQLQQRLFSCQKLQVVEGDVQSVPWQCKLGREPRLRRSNKCSVCPVNADLEIDRAVAALISENVIQSSAQCPYLAFSAALSIALLVGSEAVETAKQSERVRVNELNKALEHIDRALKTLAPNREDIEYLAAREDEEMFTRLADVFRAETLISKAVRFLNENFERNHGHKLDPKALPSVKRGRQGNRYALSVARVTALGCLKFQAWMQGRRVRPERRRVERSLYERANGYSYDAVKIFMPAGSKQPVVVHYTEHCPPDVGAAFIWLKNRDPDRWRDSQVVEHALGKYIISDSPLTEEEWAREPSDDHR